LFLNLLQLDVGKRAATVVDTAVPEAGAAAVLEAGADAVAMADAVVEKIF